MPILSPSEWDDFIHQQPGAHLLQSREWGELKAAFGWEPVRLLEDGTGAQVLFRKLPVGLSFAYLPKGPVSKGIPSPRFWSALDEICHDRHAVFIKVEPDGWEEGIGLPQQMNAFIPSPQHIQPRSTLVIDLQGSEEEIFNRMKPKTRYNIRLAGRKEVTVVVSDDLQEFYRLMSVTGQREHFHVHSLEYYRKAYELFHPAGMCELFTATCHGKSLATLMVFSFDRSAYYFYGASSDEERSRKPTYPLQWEAIKWARSRGCLEYDMWGIPDEAADLSEEETEAREDGLWGVFRFKRGFGGSIRHAIRSVDKVYSPLLYKLYLWRTSGTGSD